MRPVPLLISLALVGAALWPVLGSAEVRRCTKPDGAAVFTDRRCQDVGGVETNRADDLAVTSADGHNARFYRGGCARNLQDLVYEVTTAIDNRDANRLASVYHWTGMSGRTGYGVMSQLDALVQRPLIDVVPVMPRGPDGLDGGYYPQTSVRQSPVGLRVEQTLANSITPSSTLFGLQQHFGCWWIKGGPV